MNKSRQAVAYFSMEIGIEARIPTYSGGLGILAGDTVRAAADMKVPMVGVTLLHRKGYFYQRIDNQGWQTEEPVAWVPEDFLMEFPGRATVEIEGRPVQIRAWVSEVTGAGGFLVLVFFLDTDLPENSEWDRTLTGALYGGDARYRLCQEVVLGMGGVRMLRALGYRNIARYHMNEGHASLLGLELLDEEAHGQGREKFNEDDLEAVRGKCVFTTHTPVPAGHDQFPQELVQRVLGRDLSGMCDILCSEGMVNLTYLALNLSHYINGVAKRHGEVTRHLFARYTIDAITNGVHGATWAADSFAALFDRYIPGWRQDNFSLRYAMSIPRELVWQAHHTAKRELLRHVNRETNAGMDCDVFTIGFARRATAYKRADLLFSDLERLRKIAAGVGRIQIVYAGKAHPNDLEGHELIRKIWNFGRLLQREIPVAYLQHYDMELARMIISGVDLWLNTPEPPMEASGTSGMKAALNGVPSLSILDGWWIEGCIEGVTGWAIGKPHTGGNGPMENDAALLYEKLETDILPLYYRAQNGYLDVMSHCIALNGSFFNTHRMIEQYVLKAYFS